MNLILPVILDQVETISACVDLETQYDLLVLMGHTVGHLSSDLTRYAQRIFLHFMRVLYIVSAILRKHNRPLFKEPKPGLIDKYEHDHVRTADLFLTQHLQYFGCNTGLPSVPQTLGSISGHLSNRSKLFGGPK